MALEGGHVVPHLIERGGAGEHREHARQIEAEAVGPARLARIGIGSGQHLGATLGQVRQTAAAHRFHDDDGHAVGRGHFHAAGRLGDRVVPIQVVYLQLHEVHLGMRRQNLLQRLGAVVHGEADVAHEPVGLRLRHVVPHVVLVELGRARAA